MKTHNIISDYKKFGLEVVDNMKNILFKSGEWWVMCANTVSHAFVFYMVFSYNLGSSPRFSTYTSSNEKRKVGQHFLNDLINLITLYHLSLALRRRKRNILEDPFQHSLFQRIQQNLSDKILSIKDTIQYQKALFLCHHHDVGELQRRCSDRTPIGELTERHRERERAVRAAAQLRHG